MEASYALTALAVGIIVSYLVSEFIGRQKHIGGWWSFFVVLSSLPFLFIPGLITTIASPSAKRKATEHAVWRTVLGVVVLLWGLYLFVIYSTGYAHPKVKQTWFSWGVCAMVTGAYLVTLGLGKIKNIRPKFRENIAGNWLSSKVEQAKKSFTLPDIRTEGKSEVLYYIVEDDKPVGPLTLQQIKDKQPKAGTLVCRNGEQEWSKVEELDEFAAFVIYAPPPVNGNDKKESNDQAIKAPIVPSQGSEGVSEQSNHSIFDEKQRVANAKQDAIDEKVGIRALKIIAVILVLIFCLAIYLSI